MRRSLNYTTTLLALVVCVSSAGAIVPPRHGGSLPPGYAAAVSRDASAFQPSRPWLTSGTTAAEAVWRRHPLTPSSPVSGTFDAPVLLGAFANRPAPFTATQLQEKLLDGPNATGTLDDYYQEVSGGVFGVAGDVVDWVTVSQDDAYYEGSSNGLSPGAARTGEFIKELLDANDAAVDFGQYDNDGPDGVPNSGDDDGFVDLLVVAHSESGGECGGNSPNIWSHVNDYRLWPVAGGNAYTTNDVANGGGSIRVQDYAIQPISSCSLDLVDIGGFAHAIGRALGLPGLFDSTGNTHGIGYWGLMGHGCWNTPARPAHPSAWSKLQLGWVSAVDIDGNGSNQSIGDVMTSRTVYRLGFSDDRFRRLGECAINGSSALHCGLTTAEAAARSYAGGEGYGNNWDETIERSFAFDGSTPVTLAYDYEYDLEAGYDSVSVSVCADGGETIVATYSGVSSGSASIDISSVLLSLTPPATYAIKFRVVTDAFGSDEDGNYLSTCGAATIDDITVTGGGESYATDFEASVDGWFQDPAKHEPGEYWLVENRQVGGFDENLPGTGLLIWHVDEPVLNSVLGNSGAGGAVRGIVLEEADGQFDLLQSPGNLGDAGDPYPGSSSNSNFNSFTVPGATNNTGQPTEVKIIGIGASGSPMNAFLEAGDPAPSATSVTPPLVNNDLQGVEFEVGGDAIRGGASFVLRMSGRPDVVPQSFTWQDPQRLRGTINVFGLKGGKYDVVVTNPDGKTATLTDGVEIVELVAARLGFAALRVAGMFVELHFGLHGQEPGEVLRLSRSRSVMGPFTPIESALESLGHGEYRYVDATAAAAGTYHYRLHVILDGEVRELYRGYVTVPLRPAGLGQNTPNPFNPTTTIPFFVPAAGDVSLAIYDTKGALVRTLVDRNMSTGAHRAEWDGRDSAGNAVASGIYFYRLRVDRFSESRKMILLK